MQQFKYTAINLQKKKFSGKFIAKDEEDLAVQLSKQGLYLVSASPYSGKTPSAFFTLGTGKISLTELAAFCRQYAIMLNAGVSLLGGIEILKAQSFSRYFRSLLQMIYEDVRAGMMLSDAMSKHGRVFPEFFRSMIKVGERSGKLDIVMNSLADYYEKDSAIKKKTRQALAYPMVLLFMTIALNLLMLLFVIPTFRETLNQLNVPIEGFTKVVYDISDFLLANWLYMLAAVVLTAVALWLFGRMPAGRRCYDYLKVHLPLIRQVNINLVTSRFARGFGLLLASGMDVNDALDAVKIVFCNKDVEARFDKAAEDVRHGMALAIAFNKYRLFPDIMDQMIAVGERTASLDEVLLRSCSFFDEAVETTLNSVTSKIQPFLLLLMGGTMIVLFLAVYAPMFSIMTGLGGTDYDVDVAAEIAKEVFAL